MRRKTPVFATWREQETKFVLRDVHPCSDNALVTPAFTVTTNARLSFTQLLSLETCCDGVVLEIAIGNGAFTDILAAGGHFVSGGYNAIVGGGNPIAGRSVWNGQSAAFQNVVVDLPTAANGQSAVALAPDLRRKKRRRTRRLFPGHHSPRPESAEHRCDLREWISGTPRYTRSRLGREHR